jgi:cell division protein FtsN
VAKRRASGSIALPSRWPNAIQKDGRCATRNAPAPEAEAEAEAEAAALAAPTGEVNYYIQLSSFSDGGNASRARNQFASAWPVQFIELSGAARPVYRVRLGPISDADDAATAPSDARTAGFTDARMIKTEDVQAALQ